MTDHGVKLVGASGGCYALIGAHLASVIVVSTHVRIFLAGFAHTLCLLNYMTAIRS